MKITEKGKEVEIICTDANKYLPKLKNVKAIITSLPDMDEIGLPKRDWIEWIQDTSLNLIQCLDDKGVIFFYQTNRKHNGQVIDKMNLISKVFYENDYKLVCSKIVLKQEPNTINLFRPTFTNLFAFSKKLTSGKATPDVIHAGKMLYKNAMGFEACKLAIDYIKTKVATETILDPFCGMGSVLKISKDNGFNAIGIDILPTMCDSSKSLILK
jgi:hypothetical protein